MAAAKWKFTRAVYRSGRREGVKAKRASRYQARAPIYLRHPLSIAVAICLARSVIGSSLTAACFNAFTWLPAWRHSSYSWAMIASSL